MREPAALGTPSTQNRSFTATGTPPSGGARGAVAVRPVGHPEVGPELVAGGALAPELEQLGGGQLARADPGARLGGAQREQVRRSRPSRARHAEAAGLRIGRLLQRLLDRQARPAARPRAARSRAPPRARWAPRPRGRAPPSSRCGRGSSGAPPPWRPPPRRSAAGGRAGPRGAPGRGRSRSAPEAGLLDDPPLVGAHAEGAVALAHLHVEAQLALVHDLARAGR